MARQLELQPMVNDRQYEELEQNKRPYHTSSFECGRQKKIITIFS
jgi:hypothetical protein